MQTDNWTCQNSQRTVQRKKEEKKNKKKKKKKKKKRNTTVSQLLNIDVPFLWKSFSLPFLKHIAKTVTLKLLLLWATRITTFIDRRVGYVIKKIFAMLSTNNF